MATVYDRMVSLAACLCAQITADDLPEPCYCGPFFGGDVPFDHCAECDDGKCGQAWVRLVNAYPSSVFPNPDDAGVCTMPLAYEWEVGVARCAPVPDSNGNPPTMAANLDTADLQYKDMAAMREAIACCFGSDDVDYTLGSYTPLPVLGGCNAAVWQVWSR